MNLNNEPKPLVFVEEEEQDRLSRSVMTWLNTFPDLPPEAGRFDFETLKDGRTCLALSTIQAPYIVRHYILGGHKAEYQFKLIYRIIPGNSTDKRLKADELLNKMGVWASRNKPDLSPLLSVRVEPTTQSSLFAMYENGDEDHQILMKLTYEVI